MKKQFYFLILFGVILLIFLALHPVDVLEIHFNNYRLLIPLSTTVMISIEYTHSVSLTKVVDVYLINKTGIYAFEEKWEDSFAGQPVNGSLKNGFFVKKMNKNLGKRWEYWFIQLNHFKIWADGKQIFEQPKDDGHLILEIRQIPAFKLYVG